MKQRWSKRIQNTRAGLFASSCKQGIRKMIAKKDGKRETEENVIELVTGY